MPRAAEAAPPEAAEFFEKEVRPLLAEHCHRCHGDAKPKGGLRLTSRASVLKGGDTGPAAVAGKPEQSLLVRAVGYTDDELRMPPKGKLSDRQIAILTRWVQSGLPWPETATQTVGGPGGKFVLTEAQRRFWSFQPVKAVAAPAVRDAGWARSDLDRFILAGLEAKGLRPAAPADKRTLLRRATFDLTGLPPTPDEIDAFLKDDSPDAFRRVVDRLLASPAYGERWGRHWLDLVRYTDSFDARGLGGTMDCADAWRYRDWVVAAFNRDMPYDRFLTYQIAGDLLPGGFDRDGVIATGLLALGNWGGGDADKEKLLTDIADDQVDVVSRTFLGLTMACARCHDHKFDPLSQADYYGLAGVFFSTHILPNVGPKTDGPPMLRIPLLPPEELARREQVQQRLAALDKEIAAATEQAYRSFARAQLAQTADYLLAAWDSRQQRPAASADEVARRRGLHGFALRQWLDFLGYSDDYPLMPRRTDNVQGKANVYGWRGEPDCPNALINATDEELVILSFKVPPRGVTVHPGPSNGVAVTWQSPVAGTVRVRGRLADADPNGGDGVAWLIDLRTAGGRRELAAGDLPNGGEQNFQKGRGAAHLDEVSVRPGDRIDLLVLPKVNYICDTTVVELEISLKDGSQKWSLRDLADDPRSEARTNPHADRFGNAGVWAFRDMARSRRGGQAPGPGPGLEAWDKAVAAVRAGKLDRKGLERAAAESQKTFTLTDARSPFWITNKEDEAALPAETRAALGRLTQERDGLRRTPLPPPEFANGAQEGGVPGSPHAGVHDVPIHIRGRYDRLGELVPRRFPEVLAGTDAKLITKGSGRLELAHWLARPDHPLTARVMVNRIWQHHFGRGLVSTPSNFGKLGRPPSHPELLDWLATDFVRFGWSIKQMHRRILLSATYQQASTAETATLAADPDNVLLGRLSRQRLEAEAIRDSVLAVAGRLDRRPGGVAVRDFNAPRRTLYLMTIRSDRTGFLPLFDVADPTAPVEARTVSTVAPQALFLLNHPFILEHTRALAKRLVAEGKDDRERLGRAYTLLYGRPPQPEEERVGLEFLAGAGPTPRAWEEYCQVLLCANEFLYVD
jgi:hypothetical protein